MDIIFQPIKKSDTYQIKLLKNNIDPHVFYFFLFIWPDIYVKEI